MTMYYPPVKVFATKGTQYLGIEVCRLLGKIISSPNNTATEPIALDSFGLSDHKLDCFSNDNIRVQIPDVRNHSVVVIHTQVPDVSHGIIELFALLDAIKNAQPKEVFVVFPYMPYSRSDIESVPHSSVMATWMAQSMKMFGVKKVILLDPHAPHAKHFFEPAANEVSIVPMIADYMIKNVLSGHSTDEFAIVFPDVGALERFGKLGKILNVEMVYLTKTRKDNKENPSHGVVVGDVNGKSCWLIDDEILTGNTVKSAVKMIMLAGAKSISAIAVHPILRKNGEDSNFVAESLQSSTLEQIILTNSIPLADKVKGKDKFTTWDVAPLLAEAISSVLETG